MNCFVRAEHNFVAPDPFINLNPGIRLADYHYWKIDGYIVPNHIKGTFVYDGSTSATTGYLDNTFITGNEDSLCILYRPGAGANWEVVGSFVHNIGPSATDKRGSFTVDTLKLGEYTIGLYDYTVNMHELFAETDQLLVVSPNPSRDSFTITLPDDPAKSFTMVIYDIGGRIVHENAVLAGTSSVIWNGENNPAGVYHVVLKSEGRNIAGARLLLAR